MAADVSISAPAVTAVPQTYTIPYAQEIIPRAVTAVVDGTSAVANFVPTIEILTPAGQVVARSPVQTTIAAGGSAEVSWFPLKNRQATASSGSPYANLILQNVFLVGYWKQDETSGTSMVDSGPFGFTGTYGAAPTLGVPPLADVTAVTYAAASSQFGESLVDARCISDGAMSVEAWMKTSTAGTIQEIVCQDDNGIRYFQLRVNAANVIEYITFDVGMNIATTITGATTVTDGVKHHIVGTFDASRVMNVYVNGVADAAPISGAASPSIQIRELQVADRKVGGVHQNFFTGTIDEVALYNGALTASEVAAHHAAG